MGAGKTNVNEREGAVNVDRFGTIVIIVAVPIRMIDSCNHDAKERSAKKGPYRARELKQNNRSLKSARCYEYELFHKIT